MDNSPQFHRTYLRKLCKKFKIKQILSSKSYSYGNGQAEYTNKTLVNCLKKHLDSKKGRWFDLLEEVFRANNTTKKSSTRETRFRLAYNIEIVLPTDVCVPSRRTIMVTSSMNDDMLKENMIFLRELKYQAQIRTEMYGQQLRRY